MSTTSPPLGVVLIVGGCGFLGGHLTQAIRDEPSTSRVYVLDRVPPPRPIPNVEYLLGSITSSSAVSHAFETAKPNVVIHTASPNAYFPTHGLHADFINTNVTGTKHLLRCAKEHGVKAFVFTSTVDVYPYAPHHNIDESHPTWDVVPEKGEIYHYTKAVADTLVRNATTSDFGTVSLRVAHLYGDGDSQGIPGALGASEGSKPLFKMGDGKNFMELASTENTAMAHILAAKALLAKKPGVNGEAFHVTDGGEKVPFWDFFTKVWSVARKRDVRSELWTIPAGLIWFLVSVMEWVFWIFTVGRLKPRGVECLERSVIEFCLWTHTYDGSKARERLGFVSNTEWEVVLEKAVEWELRRREGLVGKKKN